MKTRFQKIAEEEFPAPWVRYRMAAEAWLTAFDILSADRDESESVIFYVEPPTLALCVELFVKSIAAHDVEDFVAKDFGHDTSKILRKHPEVPVFKRIADNRALMALIREYEKTIDTRYAEAGVVLGEPGRDQMLALARELETEMLNRQPR